MASPKAPTPSSAPAPAPEVNHLATGAEKFIDSLLTLVSSKSPINLNPLQMAYDVATGVWNKCEAVIKPPAQALINGSRKSIKALLGLG